MAQTQQKQKQQQKDIEDKNAQSTSEQHSVSSISTQPITTGGILTPLGATKVRPLPRSIETPETPHLDSSLWPPNPYQPSKVFITKCRAEFDALLLLIKDTYLAEIRNIYDEEIYPDLFIQFEGEQFKKPLHRCVVAARVFKLYHSLRAFQLVDVPKEEDIIVSKFQDKLDIVEHSIVEDDTLASTDETIDEVVVQKEDREESILLCDLPKNLINPDLLLSLFRRVYLEQDVSEEEFNINQPLINWIKANRPQSIKTTKRHSQHSRESFRTVQPDFEPEILTNYSRTMSPEQLINFSDDTQNNVDDLDDCSQATSVKDEAQPPSLLTRTETFELFPKDDADNSISAAQSESLVDLQTEEDKKDSSTEEQDNLAAYAPTTRTGLKPKTFTTPVGQRTSREPLNTITNKSSQVTSSKRIEPIRSKVAAVLQKAPIAKKPTASSTPQSGSKRSSLASNVSESATEGQVPKPSVTRTRTSSTAGSNPTVKSTVILRAHPISMERSQSPAASTLKGGTGRNFIAANKRLISQIEKKQAAQVDANNESETENSENSSFPLEPFTSDNMVAQLDKYTLISYSKLADSLSKMFIDGILVDTIICCAGGKQIDAHKCILATRSAYFAELISKQNLPSTIQDSGTSKVASKIDLTEFSYPVVYFSILHVYSGILKIPDDINLDELAKLSHLLHVTTLREVCVHNLRMNYCHFFHKPCNVCCLGVLKTLPIAWRYDFTSLYTKCLQWIGSHFASVFCLKEFSELKPNDLMEECYAATLSQLTPDNIIPKTIECQKLLSNLPRVKWTEPIICLIGRQLEDFCHFVADNYEKILQSETFSNLGENCWECDILEENLLAAMNHLKPDSGCKTLIQLNKIECSLEISDDNRSDSFANLVLKMRKYCERYLLKDAAAVVHCSSWKHMNPSLQKKIRDQAIISTDFDEPTKQLASKPKLPSMSRVTQNQTSRSIGGVGGGSNGSRSPSNRSTPESRLKSPNTTALPPPKNRPVAARHVKVLK